MSNLHFLGYVTGMFFAFAISADDYAAGQPQGAAPNFSSVDFPWLPTSAEYAPPASGPGPVTYDHAHPVMVRNPNAAGAVVEVPMRLADLDNSNLKPWVIAVLKKANDETLAGKERLRLRDLRHQSVVSLPDDADNLYAVILPYLKKRRISVNLVQGASDLTTLLPQWRSRVDPSLPPAE